MLLELAATRRVLFIGGKGGVGKTAVASAVGLHQARAGRRVLVVSTDPAHNLGHLWQTRVGDEVVTLAHGLAAQDVARAAAQHRPGMPADGRHNPTVGQHAPDGRSAEQQAPGGHGAGQHGPGSLEGLEIDPARTTDEHLAAVGHQVRRLMPEHLAGEVDKHLDLARDAPGTHEAAVLERMAEVLENSSHDLVIFDTAPSGHTSRLMSLPETMYAWTEGLLRRQDRSAKFGAALRAMDPDEGAEAIVGTGRRRADRRAERDSQIRHILLRRRTRFEGLRDLLTDAERTAFVIVLAAERLPALETIELYGQLLRSGVHVGALVVNKRSPAEAGGLLADRHAQEEVHLDTVREALGHVPMIELPLLAGDIVGEEAVARFADLIARAS